tara:strand:- start:467 stop:1678 length:1212 start_codon:yes stop_codon:yes gene_type:complete
MRFLPIWCLLILGLGQVCAEDLGITHARQLEMPQLPKPGYLETVVDPVFGSEITRVTGDTGAAIPGVDSVWNAVARHGYSKEGAWNCDQSLLWIRTHHGFPSMIFLDGASYKPVFGRNIGPGSEARWTPNRPDYMVFVKDNTIGFWNVREDTTKIVVTLPGYSEFGIGPWEGNLSNDGRLVAISAKNGGRQVAFVYDLEKRAKYPDVEFAIARLDWVSISTSGKYLVANGKFSEGQGDQSQVYDLQGNRIGALWSEYGRPSHFDLTIDENGDDIAVGVSKSKPDLGRVIKRRLRDGAVTVLTSGGFAGHSSTRNLDRPGWAYVTYQYSGPDWPPFWNEVVAVKLDGSQIVERIAHLHAPRTDYLTEAHAVPSPDGKRVIWASSWGAKASGRPVSAYVARLKGR